MEVLSQSQRSSSLSSSSLNPNAPMFIPLAYRTVEDFSDEWWELIQSSPWFRDYWLQERYFDPQQYDPLSVNVPEDIDALFNFDDENHTPAAEEKAERYLGKKLVSIGKLKWSKGRDLIGKAKYFEKAPKIVNVKVTPRMIQQPR